MTDDCDACRTFMKAVEREVSRGKIQGEMAAAIDPKLLVLSHNMQRALVRQQEGEAAIRQHYEGPMVVADDLACFAL